MAEPKSVTSIFLELRAGRITIEQAAAQLAALRRRRGLWDALGRN
ncbi:hypothetical protein [Aureimonas glaciei]|nr:hypothetical protein [Aureimonas glaciei]